MDEDGHSGDDDKTGREEKQRRGGTDAGPADTNEDEYRGISSPVRRAGTSQRSEARES